MDTLNLFDKHKSEFDALKVERKLHLAEKVVIVDGLPGCGKTMLSPIVAALDRVEKLTYTFEIELICQLSYLRKIDYDAAIAIIKIFIDIRLYNIMMSRETNFRPSDLSSIFRDIKPLRYIRRLFQKGDEAIPERVKREKPILHLTTHSLTGISEPVFSALGNKVVIIEMVRHPLYMIKQQTMNMERILSDARYFPICFLYKDSSLPCFAFGWEDLFLNSNDVEKSIYQIDEYTKKVERVKRDLIEKYKAQILTIPFESFVTDPWPYIKQIEHYLETKSTAVTRRMMKRQNVPRKMYADSIGLKIYKRCRWEPPKSSSENYEFELRRQFARKRASKEAMRVLDERCTDYEKQYLGGEIKEYKKQ